MYLFFFFFSSRRRHTRSLCDWSSDVCSSDLGHLSHETEQGITKLRWADSFATNDRAHRGYNIGGRGIFQQIASHAGADRSHEVIFIGVHPDQHSFEAKHSQAFEGKTCGKPIRLEGTDDEYVAVCFQDTLNRQIRLPALPNDREIGTLAQKSNQRLTKQTVFDQQKYAYRFAGDRFAHLS